MSAPFSGNKKNLGNEMYMGANAYFQNVNENGGIYSRFVKLVLRDNRYEPVIAIKNAFDFINKDKIFAFFGTVGTPTSKAILPIAIKYEMPFLGTFSGAGFLRNSEKSIVLNERVSYEEETQKLIEYYVDKKKFTRIAVFYQNDSYDRYGLRGVRKALDKRNLKIIGEGSYKRNTLSVGNALYEISLTRPEAVILAGTTLPVAQFIVRARKNKKFNKNVKFGVLSFVSPKLLVKSVGHEVKQIIFSQVVPSPWNSQKKQVIDYRKLMKKYYPKQDYSFVSLEGYFAAKMTVQLFRDVGKNFTKSDFLRVMHRLSQKINDNSRSINPTDECVCLHRVHLMRYINEKFEPIVDDLDEK
ncbi:MAG: ABC transporter substrate-binding protein [Campylobacteraceae bacterium]|nr:ABC transporter substrate-binding protein [Campylobacteraceae bacterium]